MPKYELCYILSAQVSDDQVPAVTDQIRKYIEDFGGEDIEEQQLGKKKLAYPIKKTRNGFYVVVVFNVDSKKINKLEAKIRSQTATIIRYLLINLEEHLKRSAKDKAVQASLPTRKTDETLIAAKEPDSIPAPETIVSPTSEAQNDSVAENIVVDKKPETKLELSESELDKKIEEALSENIK